MEQKTKVRDCCMFENDSQIAFSCFKCHAGSGSGTGSGTGTGTGTGGRWQVAGGRWQVAGGLFVLECRLMPYSTLANASKQKHPKKSGSVCALPEKGKMAQGQVVRVITRLGETMPVVQAAVPAPAGHSPAARRLRGRRAGRPRPAGLGQTRCGPGRQSGLRPFRLAACG